MWKFEVHFQYDESHGSKSPTSFFDKSLELSIMDIYFFGDISAALDLFVGLIPKYLDESMKAKAQKAAK